MKKLYALVLMTFLAFGTLSFAVAQGASVSQVDVKADVVTNIDASATSELDTTSSGEIIPDRKIGVLENLVDNLRYRLAFNANERAQIALENAEKRLAAARFDNADDATRAEDGYGAWMVRYMASLRNMNLRLSEAGYSEEEIARIIDANARLNVHRELVMRLYEQQKAQLDPPPTSAPAGGVALARLDGFYTNALDYLEESESVAEDNTFVARTVIKARTGGSDEEVNARLQMIRLNGAGITDIGSFRVRTENQK